MTADQRIIAEAAIAGRQAADFGVIQQEVSLTTGVPVAEVKKTLDHLSKEFVLKECATPARNHIENPAPIGEITWGWYEKGEMWPR